MSTAIAYQNKHLGNIRFDELRKICFVANDLGCLEILLRLNPEDIVQVEETPVSYSEFRTKYLERIDGFYPSFESWLYKSEFGLTKQISEKEEKEFQRHSKGEPPCDNR